MKRTDHNVFRKILCIKNLICFTSVFLLFNVFLTGKIKVTEASKTGLKLSECISEHSKTEIPLYEKTPMVFSESNIPRIFLTGEVNPKLAFSSGMNFITYDYKATKILKSYKSTGLGISGILSAPGLEKIYVSQKLLKGKSYDYKFSQMNLETGKMDWTLDIGFTNLIELYWLNTRRLYIVPYQISPIPEKQQVMLIGLTFKKFRLFKGDRVSNRILVLDSKSGEIVSDREFNFRRFLTGSKELFINAESMDYEIMDIFNGNVFLKGKINIGDLPHGKNYIAVDKKRLSPYIIMPGKEFSAHLLKKGFIITSRDCYKGAYGSIKTSTWVLYDENGKRIKKIFPAPKTSMDLAVNNLGHTQWPLYMTRTKSRGKMRRTRVDMIIALNEDGSYSEIELPVIEGLKEFLHLSVNNWFHKGDTFYYTKDGNIYKFKIGEKTGELIYAKENKDKCENIGDWDSKYIMLTPSEYFVKKGQKAILIRLSDGKKIAPSEFNENLDTVLWKKVMDFNQSYLPLPVIGAAPGLKKYLDYDYTKDFEGKTKKSSHTKYKKFNTMFKVWGNFRKKGKYRDIGIVPAILNDKSAVLVGINIADNKPLFSIPVLKFSGMPQGSFGSVYPSGIYLPFNIIKLNDSEALLLVLEKLNSLKIYLIKR